MTNPTHAGQLITEWLDELKENGRSITITQLADSIHLTRSMLSRIINGKSPLTVDIALRLQDALGINSDLLMKVQVHHSLWVASQKVRPTIQPLYQYIH